MLSLFWNNRISTTTTASQPPQPHLNEPHLHNTHRSHQPSPQQTSPHLHLPERCHLVTSNRFLNERHRHRQTRGVPCWNGSRCLLQRPRVGADLCNVRSLRVSRKADQKSKRGGASGGSKVRGGRSNLAHRPDKKAR